MGRLDAKVAIVTGAARGTGAETARAFVEEGARLLLTDVLDDAGEQVAKELGAAARYQTLDVRDPAQWSAAVSAAREHFGPVTTLVNNAAILDVSALTETTPETLDAILAVNLKGPFLGTQAVVDDMRAAGGGSIVNVSSIDGLEGELGVAAYASSKWGLRGLTKCAALELGRYAIRVNTLCPGGGSDEMKAPFVAQVQARIKAGEKIDLAGMPRSPMGRQGTLREYANAIVFLASDESSFVSGADLAVDGAFTAGHMFPGAPTS